MSNTGRPPVKCATCGTDCSAMFAMCDEEMKEWCPPCFEATPCGKGEHGEGCPTFAFDDLGTPRQL